MGLTGPQGVLPSHFTRLLLRRLRAKDATLRDFFDLLNHRRVALFYRTGRNIGFRSPTKGRGGKRSRTTTPSLAACFRWLDWEPPASAAGTHWTIILFYIMEDYSRHHPRSAVALEGMLGHQFGVPVRIEQFQGQWLNLQERDRSMLPGGCEPDGRHNRQGRDVVLGKRVWNVESKFRIRLGRWARRFLPIPSAADRRVFDRPHRAHADLCRHGI